MTQPTKSDDTKSTRRAEYERGTGEVGDNSAWVDVVNDLDDLFVDECRKFKAERAAILHPDQSLNYIHLMETLAGTLRGALVDAMPDGFYAESDHAD